VGRIKDVFKTPAGRQVSPSQVEDVLLSEPQGLIAEVVVAGVMPSLSSDDDKGLLIPRAWIILSDKGKKLGGDVVMKELKVWYQERLSNHKWLNGGFEFVDEVCMVFNTAQLSHIFDVDPQNIRQAVKSSIAEKVWRAMSLSDSFI
jgi:acyl-CoA synthetase (AMP-forming)/AMP-acid ligase II